MGTSSAEFSFPFAKQLVTKQARLFFNWVDDTRRDLETQSELRDEKAVTDRGTEREMVWVL